MLPFITLLLVIALSMLISKIATIALARTGMSVEIARFQARSAFSGAGFTTSASEGVVNHPVRRKIIMWLILFGNAGLVSVAATLIIGLGEESSERGPEWIKYAILFSGAMALIAAARSQIIDRFLTRRINWLLSRYSDHLTLDLTELIGISGEYGVVEFDAIEHPALVGKALSDLRLREQGILVLGIHTTNAGYLGVPRGRYTIEEDDRLVLYGMRSRLEDLHSGAASPLPVPRGQGRRMEEHREELEEQDRKLEKSEEPSSDTSER